MDLKIQHLGFLMDARQTLLTGKNSNVARLNNLKKHNFINEEGESFFKEQGIVPFDAPLEAFKYKIIDILSFIPIYNDWLKDINGVTVFDSANLIMLIEDVERFEDVNHFKSYCGVTPVVNCKSGVSKMKPKTDYSNCDIIGNEKLKTKHASYNERIKPVIGKIISQMIKYNDEYMDLFESLWQEEREKDLNITKKHVTNRVKRKLAQRFLKSFYQQWKALNKELKHDEKGEYSW